MQCPKCGKQNEAEAKFCNACGTSLDQAAADTRSEAEASHLDLLRRYISKPLAEKMQALGGRLEGERRHVTVVFADISGFTAMSGGAGSRGRHHGDKRVFQRARGCGLQV